MKKKTTEIAKNTSSGAEKVETIEKQVKMDDDMMEKSVKTTQIQAEKAVGVKENTAKDEAALGNGKGEVNTNTLAKKEAQSAKKRVELAQERKKNQAEKQAARLKRKAERKAKTEKRLAEYKAKIEKTLAERKAKAEKRLAERKARIEKRKAEREEQIRERAHEKANRNQENHKKKTAKAAQKSQRKAERKQRTENNGERNKGYGGWLAAVISLGVVTLGLTTAVTVGAVEMRNTKMGAISTHRGTMYELTGVMEQVDGDLEKARISNSPVQQSRILTDLLVQARVAEMDLEHLPITAEEDGNISAFLNRTAMECERMLQKLRKGEKLDEFDFQRLEELYATNYAVCMEMQTLMSKISDKDITEYLKDGAGNIGESLNKLKEMTMDKGRELFEKGKEKIPHGKVGEFPNNIAENMPKTLPSMNGKDCEKIQPKDAEEICNRWFADYNIKDFRCVGETTTQMLMAYNVQGYDEKGTMLFAEIDQKTGALIRFDYYEDCAQDTFDIQNAERIAEQFLDKLGYDDMEVVRFRENGTMTDFVFVYEDDDVAYYPDEVHVKICRSRGVVTGFDASKYLENHRERKDVDVALTLGQAYEKLHEKLSVESSRLAVLKMGKREIPAYEFLCSYGEDKYFVYVDANTGDELRIVNARTN